MAISVKYREELVGNTAISLDSTASTDLFDRDLAFTLENGKIYAHRWTADSIDIPSVPFVVIPYDNPTEGRWILQSSPFDMGVPVSSEIMLTGNVLGFDINMDDTRPEDSIIVTAGMCYDSTNTVLLFMPAAHVATIPSIVANETYYVFITNNGLIEFDTDVDGQNLFDSGVSSLRWLGMIHTNTTGNICGFFQSGDTCRFIISSENIHMTGVNATPVPLDITSIIDPKRVDILTLGGQRESGTESARLAIVDSNGNIAAKVATEGPVSDTAHNAWYFFEGPLTFPYKDGLLIQATNSTSDSRISMIKYKR